MVGMSVTDEHRIDLVGVELFQQSRQRRVTGVDEQPEPVVLDEVPAARLARRRPRAAPAENRQPHPGTLLRAAASSSASSVDP